MDYEFVIVGAGVVGLACAMNLSENSNSVLILERHESFGNETSSRNSEVIHAGIYYPNGSLKAKLCVEGNRMLYDWCTKNAIPHRRIGKFIVAVDVEESDRIDEICQNGKENGVQNLQQFPIDKFRKEEPYIKAHSVLWSPDTGIINSHLLMESFEIVANNNGCDFAWQHEVKRIEKIYGGYKIYIDSGGEVFDVSCEKIINAAGLDSDTIAAMGGLDTDVLGYNLHYCRGHYFRIAPSKHYLAKHLIYPVPQKKMHGLGIHITLEMDGQLKLGPDTYFMKERKQEYIVPSELHDKFFQAASSYIIGLDYNDIFPDQSGIRPKLQVEGGPYRDFIIKEESENGLPGFINLIGIESPGLTCSLSIADYVSGIVR